MAMNNPSLAPLTPGLFGLLANGPMLLSNNPSLAPLTLISVKTLIFDRFPAI
jgi:hypothetical protein